MMKIRRRLEETVIIVALIAGRGESKQVLCTMSTSIEAAVYYNCIKQVRQTNACSPNLKTSQVATNVHAIVIASTGVHVTARHQQPARRWLMAPGSQQLGVVPPRQAGVTTQQFE